MSGKEQPGPLKLDMPLRCGYEMLALALLMFYQNIKEIYKLNLAHRNFPIFMKIFLLAVIEN